MMERADSHFVECGGDTQKVYHAAVEAVEAYEGAYPTLRAATAQADPGLTQTTAIANVTALQAINSNLGGNYYLTGDIDASVTSTWNAGAGFAPINADFTGTLDGCGYTITGLFINRPTEDKVGLFSQFRNGAKVANLTLSNVNITGLSRVGALMGNGYSDGAAILVQNCHSSGTVSLSGAFVYTVGGLIGYIYKAGAGSVSIYDCTSSCTIDGSTNVTDTAWSDCGGLIGDISGLTIANCSASGTVNGGAYGSNVGGLIGFIDDNCTVSDCSATGTVSGNSYVGGFAGQQDASNTIARCSATGNVTATGGTAAGFTTSSDTSTITDCYAWGNATSTANLVSGFIEDNATTVCTRCYSKGLLTGTGHIVNDGGFNYTGTGGTVTDCYWDIETSGATTSDGGTGKTTTKMKTKSTYSGWNFTTVWYMGDTAAVVATDAYWTETSIGYGHLEGETVSILADGVVYADQVVTDGAIVETAFADAEQAHVGLAYESKLKPMKPVSQPDMMSATVTCKQMGISVHNTDDIEYGVDDGDMHDINFDDVQWKNKCEIDGLFTGTVAVSVPDGFSVNLPLQITTDAPLPCTVRAMIPKVD